MASFSEPVRLRTDLNADDGAWLQALQADWLETLAGATPPRTGHVIAL